MDWIEQVLGVSPDGGSGLTEILVVLVVATVITLAGLALVRWNRA